MGVAAEDGHVVHAAMRADGVVELGEDIAFLVLRLANVKGGDQPVGRAVSWADFVVVHVADELAVSPTVLDERLRRRGGRGNPRGSGHDVLPYPVPDVRVLVFELDLAVE